MLSQRGDRRSASLRQLTPDSKLPTSIGQKLMTWVSSRFLICRQKSAKHNNIRSLCDTLGTENTYSEMKSTKNIFFTNQLTPLLLISTLISFASTKAEATELYLLDSKASLSLSSEDLDAEPSDVSVDTSSSDPVASRKYVAISGTVLGKGSMIGFEIEAIINPQFRVGSGLGVSILGTISVPVYVSWYPWGSASHGMYVDAGTTLLRFPECCGGPENGGSAARLFVIPDVGLGYAYQGENLLLKFGLEFGWLDDTLVTLPGVRFGYMF